MVRSIAIVTWLVWSSGAALADIRPDGSPKHVPAPSPAPSSEPRAQGCASSRQAMPEWIIAATVLGLGAWGLRRTAPRRVPAR